MWVPAFFVQQSIFTEQNVNLEHNARDCTYTSDYIFSYCIAVGYVWTVQCKLNSALCAGWRYRNAYSYLQRIPAYIRTKSAKCKRIYIYIYTILLCYKMGKSAIEKIN